MRTRPNKNTMSIKIRNPFNILLFLFQTLLLLKKRRKNYVKSQKLVLGWQQNVYLYFVHASLRPIFLPIDVLWTQWGNFSIFVPLKFSVKTKFVILKPNKLPFLTVSEAVKIHFGKFFAFSKPIIY